MKECFDDIFNTNPRITTTTAFVLGLLLIDNLTVAEQNLLGNFIISIGQTILTNASSQNLIETRIHGGIININSNEVKAICNPVIYDINKIKEIINEVYPDNRIDLHMLKNALDKIQENIDILQKKDN